MDSFPGGYMSLRTENICLHLWGFRKNTKPFGPVKYWKSQGSVAVISVWRSGRRKKTRFFVALADLESKGVSVVACTLSWHNYQDLVEFRSTSRWGPKGTITVILNTFCYLGLCIELFLPSLWWHIHRENGGTLGMVPLVINPMYTTYIVAIYWVHPLLKVSLEG